MVDSHSYCWLAGNWALAVSRLFSSMACNDSPSFGDENSSQPKQCFFWKNYRGNAGSKGGYANSCECRQKQCRYRQKNALDATCLCEGQRCFDPRFFWG